MIYEVSGDITKTKAKAIAHGIAPNDDFKKGLAMALKKSWPALYKDFRHYCHTKHPRPGTNWTWGAAGGIRIFNLMAQEGAYDKGTHPGPASLHNLHKCIKDLKKAIIEENVKSIAIPKIATGVGGLNWGDVYPIIKKELESLDIPIYLYINYRQDKEANEPN